MKQIVSISTLAIALLILFNGPLAAQFNTEMPANRWDVELTGGVSMATYKLGGADLNTGGGFEAAFHYRITPNIGAYAGWGWNKFSADRSFAGDDMDFEETGYVFGMQYIRPFGNSNFSGYLRLGGLYNHIELENADGDITDDTGHGLGWQLAGGIEIPVGQQWKIIPGVKFNALSRELNSDEPYGKQQLDLNYITFRTGIVRSF